VFATPSPHARGGGHRRLAPAACWACCWLRHCMVVRADGAAAQRIWRCCRSANAPIPREFVRSLYAISDFFERCTGTYSLAPR
jgi:hypothetical protein